MKGMKIMFLVLILSMAVAMLWNHVPAIKQTVHAILDPSMGKLLEWNTTYGMFLFVISFSIIMTLIQKYGTDQATLKELKKEQKLLQQEAKKYKDDPQKLLEFNKKQFEFIPKIMEISMRPVIYTIIPFILFLRWFSDYFADVEFKFLFLNWFWFYFIFMIIFSSVFKKIFKTV